METSCGVHWSRVGREAFESAYAEAGVSDLCFDPFLERRLIFFSDFWEASDLSVFYDFWVRYALEIWCLFFT